MLECHFGIRCGCPSVLTLHSYGKKRTIISRGTRPSKPFSSPLIENQITLVAALGNAFPEYQGTRHNLGFYLLDELIQDRNLQWDKMKSPAVWFAQELVNQRRVYYVKPQGFINLSGLPIAQFARYFNITADQSLILFDDYTITLGSAKISPTKGPQTHNGYASVCEHLGMDFIRYRIGIGDKPKEIAVKDFVLGRFLKSEQEVLRDSLPDLLKILQVLIDKGPVYGMNVSKFCRLIHEKSIDKDI